MGSSAVGGSLFLGGDLLQAHPSRDRARGRCVRVRPRFNGDSVVNP